MSKVFLLLLVLLCFSSAIAATEQYGTIKLEVVNYPPVMAGLEITPEGPYYDSVLTCVPSVQDENPGEVDYAYKWYRNGELLAETGDHLSGFEDGDVVECQATPTDKWGMSGESRSSQAAILKAPVQAKIVKPILAAAGIDVSARELAESTSMAAVTGMAITGKTNSGITLIFTLGIFAAILVAVNLILLVRRMIRYPRQDYSSS